MYTHSDHKFVAISLSSFDHVQMGGSYWKFNNSLLEDTDYLDYMKIMLVDCVSNIPSDESLLNWWDNLKGKIKTQTILFSKRKRKREKYELDLLQKEYCVLERQGEWEKANPVKQRLAQISEKK